MKGESVMDVIERDDGHITVSMGAEVYFADFDDWRPIEKQAMNYASGRVLDVGCGAARHALYLQKQGLEVVGIDTSPLAVFISQRRGLKNVLNRSITQVSSKMGDFDTVMMLGNNFGLMANFSRARWLLRRFYSMTPSTGRIIAASSDPHLTDDIDHLTYHDWNRERGRMAGQVRIRNRYRRFKDTWFDYLFVSKNEMTRIVEGTGWQIKEFLDSEGSLYIAIIEKHPDT